MSWYSIVGLPVVIRSDGAHGFDSNEFKEWAGRYGIAWQVSAAFLPAYNGQAERAVRTVKDVLKRKGDLIDFKASLIQINAMQRGKDGGSASEIFLGRASRNLLPGSKRMPRQEEVIMKRREMLEKIYSKKRKNNREKFEVGDPVWMQDPMSKRWVSKGVIIEARTNQDGRQTTFLIKGDSGREYLRNETMLQAVLPSDPESNENNSDE